MHSSTSQNTAGVLPNQGLVLSGGGARAAYQAGALRYIGEAFPDLHFPIYNGVSAGSINAAYLANSRDRLSKATAELAQRWRELGREHVFRSRSLPEFLGLFIESEQDPHLSFFDASPLRTYLQHHLGTEDGRLHGVRENLRSGTLKALALTTANYSTNQTVTWVQGREIEDWERPNRTGIHTDLTIDHIMASAAAPILFPAVWIESAWYGDGGIRLLDPLAPAIHLGAERLLVISTRYQRSLPEAEGSVDRRYPTFADMGGMLMNAIFLDVLEHDMAVLERINALVEKIPEEERGGLKPIDLFVLHPSEDIGALASKYPLDLEGTLGWLFTRLASRDGDRPDWLSMIQFDPEYIERLLEIGYEDAKARHNDFKTFFEESLRVEPRG